MAPSDPPASPTSCPCAANELKLYDFTFTDKVIAATGPKCNPRLRTVISSLIRHLHDFARENNVTVEEWMQGVEIVCFLLCLSPQSMFYPPCHEALIPFPFLFGINACPSFPITS